MHKELEYYRAFGQPASGFIEFLTVPPVSPGLDLRIGDTDVYSFGQDFFGDSPNKLAQSLCACINTDLARPDLTQLTDLSQSFIRPVFAKWIGNRVVLIATFPGDAGNAIALVSAGATDSVNLSGSFLTGGTSPAGGGEAVTIADGSDVALGSTTDGFLTDPAATGTLIAFTKGEVALLENIFGEIDAASLSTYIPQISSTVSDISSGTSSISSTLSNVDSVVSGILSRQPATAPTQGAGAVDGSTLRVTSASAQRPITRTAATSGATIAAGFRRITLVSSATYAGNVAGVAFPANFTESYVAPDGDTLGTLVYTVSAGTLTISTIG